MNSSSLTTTAAVDIIVDDEFAALIPPSSADEQAILKGSLLRDGCRDPLRVTPDGILLDGHNRLRICRENGIDFTVELVNVADRDAALLWVIDNQLGRRNLPKPARIKLAMKREPLIRALAKANSGTRTDLLQNSAGGSASVVTREAAAKLAGVSHDTYGKAKRVFEQGEPELVRAMETETVSIHAAAQVAELPAVEQKAVVAAGKVKQKAKEVTLHRRTTGGNDEWYTPKPYVDAAREVLGEIDLDPATCAKAQKCIQAKSYYVKSRNGLEQPWRGRVWLNPPFSRNLIGKFVDKLIKEYDAGNVTAAVLITNSETASEWFQTALAKAACECFVNKRIRFINARGGNDGTPRASQAFFYFGNDAQRFTDVFARFGQVVASVMREEAADGRGEDGDLA